MKDPIEKEWMNYNSHTKEYANGLEDFLNHVITDKNDG